MVTEEIQLEGHIIDSLILSKVLDEIVSSGGDFSITHIQIGQKPGDRSEATIEVSAPTAEALSGLVARIGRMGATVRAPLDAEQALAGAAREFGGLLIFLPASPR